MTQMCVTDTSVLGTVIGVPGGNRVKKMNDQLNLFSLIEAPDINDIPESEAVQIVGNRLGVQFKYNDFFDLWEAKCGKMHLALSYGRFFPDVFDGRLFLGADYWIQHSGGSAPCDGIDEATAYFQRKIEEWGQ